MSKLLKPATNETAFLKCGIMGFEGSGKTFTATSMAIGLTHLMQSKLDKKFKLAFFDTETGSDFIIERCKKAGLELDVAKSRAFVDLCDFMREAEADTYSVAIIDSISHVWKELCAAYLKRTRKQQITMQGWMAVKGEWQQFSDLFVNTKVHVIMLGRAGYEYDFREDEDGKKSIAKVGTKMKVEGEMGYEPSLLLEMTRMKKSDVQKDPELKGWVNRCTVLKDRTNTINGHVFDYPNFDSFKPFINFLNIGGRHLGVNLNSSSAELFENPDRSWAEKVKRRDIALESLHESIVLAGLDGTKADVKKAKVELMIEMFGTSSKTAIENQPEYVINDAIDLINKKFKLRQYANVEQIEPKAVENDVR